MSDEQTQNPNQGGGNLLSSVKSKINKARRDAFESKLKGLVEKQLEHQKALKQLEQEIDELNTEFEEGKLS
jgi:DNA-binding FrmR family transcriptional regulator